MASSLRNAFTALFDFVFALELEEAAFRFNFSFGIIIAISFFLTVCLFSILLPDLPPPSGIFWSRALIFSGKQTNFNFCFEK